MEGVGQGIILAFIVFFVFGLFIAFVISFAINDGTISSKKRIEPRIELIINNNQLDTLFVYEVK